MIRITVYLDCPNYQKGGWCRLKGRSVGALQEACEDALTTPESKREDARAATEKQCRRCGKVLPVDHFSKCSTMVDGLQSYCKECSALMYKSWVRNNKNVTNNKKSEDMEPNTTQKTKTCTKCGRELTLDRFYTNRGIPNSICKKEEVKKHRKPKGAKKPAESSPEAKQVVVRETLTDKQMVETLRTHGWTVTCCRQITEEL